jgi:hypothetical protein
VFVKIDLSAILPRVGLEEPDDFSSFKIVVAVPDHAYVTVDELERLAGARMNDPNWRSRLEGMLSFAEQHGWRDSDGAVRAHVEVER